MDFVEKNNFNWSCRTHLQEFDNDTGMWWCCGSRDPNKRGCKLRKHKSRKENLEDFDSKKRNSNLQYLVRCICCKK